VFWAPSRERGELDEGQVEAVRAIMRAELQAVPTQDMPTASVLAIEGQAA
jgi:hypothetical protein